VQVTALHESFVAGPTGAVNTCCRHPSVVSGFSRTVMSPAAALGAADLLLVWGRLSSLSYV